MSVLKDTLQVQALIMETRFFSQELLTQHVAIIIMIIGDCWAHFLAISFNLKDQLAQHKNAQCKQLFRIRDLE